MGRSLFALLVLLTLAAAGCVKKDMPALSASPAARDGASGDSSPILLGVVLSLSGSHAEFSTSVRNGITLAVDEVNRAGGVKGRRVELRAADSRSTPEGASQAAARLISEEGVVLLLGEVSSPNSLAVAEQAQAARVPMITPTSTNPAITDMGDYIFRACFIDPVQGRVMAKFARADLGLSRVAVLRNQESAYSTSLAAAFMRTFTELGGTVVLAESYAPAEDDFGALLTSLEGAQPEAIYMPG